MDIKNELRAALNYAEARIDNGVDVLEIVADAEKALHRIESEAYSASALPMTNRQYLIQTLQDAVDDSRRADDVAGHVEEVVTYLLEIRDDEMRDRGEADTTL